MTTASVVPRPTNLVLNQEQERKLVDYLLAKKTSLVGNNAARIANDTEAWNRYWLDCETRKGLEGSVFTLSNVPIPVFPMIVEHFCSRIEESTSADTPFWKFEATGQQERKARNYTNFFGWKLEQGGVHKAMLDSQLPTIIQSASVQKATYSKDVIHWVDRTTRVLHDRRTGVPVESITNGPVIEHEDQWEARPDTIQPDQEAPALPMPAPDQQASGGDGMDAGGTMDQPADPMGAPPAPPLAPVEPRMRQHLVDDPTVIFNPAHHEWRLPEAGLRRSQVLFSGAKSEHVRYDRIFCAMEAESFEKSDVMELQDRSFDWFRANWLERTWDMWESNKAILKTGDTTAKTGQMDTNQPVLGATPTGDTNRAENRAYDQVNPLRAVAEFWVERDVLGDGSMPPQRFVCWLDLALGKLVNYEWQAMVCPDMKRPYSVTALSKPPNRWCGRSIWQRGKHLFEAVDRLFNGEFFRTLQQANPPKGGDPGAAVEEPTEIAFDPTKYWELKPGRTIDQLLQYAKVPDTNQRTQQVMEFIIFWIQLWLGVSNIAQGDYAAVPANSTATGISKTLQEASLLGRRWIRRKLEADEDHLTKLVKIIIATSGEDGRRTEVYEFNDGDARQTAEILTADVRTLNIHVTVIEQQHYKEQDVARCKAGVEAITSFFSQLNPAIRSVTLPFYIEILQDLGFKSAAQQLEATNEIPMTSEMGGQLVQGPDGKPMLPPPEPPGGDKEDNRVKASLAITAKWDQISAPAREQVLAENGIHVPPGSEPETVAPSPNPADKPAPASRAAAD